jgi:beta-glucosidase/6-phospho-beta-glucosidase/beta-galactosidase
MSDFLWGVATSAYQSEGGYNGFGQPQTNWASAERQGEVAESGLAADFWNRYPEDFERCRKLGINAFRLGIEWSRVQPTFSNQKGAPPPFDYKALDHYATMLAECRQNGLEPVLTLHHFVHPSWLGPDPWLDSTTVKHFSRYVEETTRYVNRALTERFRLPPVKYYITINEPNMLVLNTYFGSQFPRGSRQKQGLGIVYKAYCEILISHVRAYNVIHRLAAENDWPEPMVTFNTYCSDIYWSEKILLDLASVRERGIKYGQLPEYIFGKIREFEAAFIAARIPLHKDIPFLFGAGLKRFTNWLGYKTFLPKCFARLFDEIYRADRKSTFDYIGLDYYDPFAAHMFRHLVWWDHEFKNKSLRSWLMNSVTSKWWDWRVLPAGMRFFCEYYNQDYGNRPVLIAENGMALRRRFNNGCTSIRKDRVTHSQFLQIHVQEVMNLIKSDVPLIGYLHWSLFDNYEWGSFAPRFGLFSIDYMKGTDRLAKDHLGDTPSQTYAQLIADSRKELKVTEVAEATEGKIASHKGHKDFLG